MTGKAADAVEILPRAHDGDQRENSVYAVAFVDFWQAPMRDSANSMTLGGALAKHDSSRNNKGKLVRS